MKANELSCKDLMVGDWVRIKITQHNTKVTNIDANSVYTKAAFPIRYDEIEPIPLTQEILEKNGFKKEISEDGIHYRFSIVIDGVLFSVKYALSVFQWLGPLDFKYVYQLQHALRLCGIEKEIEL